jgi:ATP-binding cassette subfamily F protein uup
VGSSSTIAFEGEGHWREYEGSVEDWLVQSRRAATVQQGKGQKGLKPANNGASALLKNEQPSTPSTAPAAPSAKTRKLSFKEQRELDTLPARIAELEAEQKAIHAALADGRLYASDNARALQLSSRNAQIDDELMVALERWENLGS